MKVPLACAYPTGGNKKIFLFCQGQVWQANQNANQKINALKLLKKDRKRHNKMREREGENIEKLTNKIKVQ